MGGIVGSDRWELLPRDVDAEHGLVSALGVSPLVARVLVARGVRGVDEALIACARGLLDGVDDCIEGLVADGLATWRDGRLVPTQRGWLLGNELFGRLWDLAS